MDMSDDDLLDNVIVPDMLTSFSQRIINKFRLRSLNNQEVETAFNNNYYTKRDMTFTMRTMLDG